MLANGSGPVRPWSASDDQHIRREAGRGAERLGVDLNRTLSAVRNRAGILKVRLGRSAPLSCISTDITDEAIRRHILSAIEPDPFGGCWLWAYLATCDGGYGRVGIRGYRGSAHRASYRAFRGRIDGGLSVLHRCDVRACVNPAHLFLGTPQDNTDDMIRKGRGAKRRGESNTQAKLTAGQVADIRRRLGSDTPQKVLAAEYGVTASTISDIKYGRSWGPTL